MNPHTKNINNMASCLDNLLFPIPSHVSCQSDKASQHPIAADIPVVYLNIPFDCRPALADAVARFRQRSFTQSFYQPMPMPSSHDHLHHEVDADNALLGSIQTMTLETSPSSSSSPSIACQNLHLSPKQLSHLSREDERFKLVISSTSLSPGIHLSASHPVGLLRGLTTLSQLIQYNSYTRQHTANTCNGDVTIIDEPRYEWRGLMVDTARHYLPIIDLKRVIRGMEMLKLNVFHWHIVDAQSFPFVSHSHPLLAQEGSYNYPEASYSTASIQNFVRYAADMGIRVVPELDMPGHTQSWGASAGLTVPCPTLVDQDDELQEHGVDKISLNPLLNKTYDFIHQLLSDFAASFPEQVLHIGGDEVNGDCWKINKNIRHWIEKKGGNHASNLQAYFERKLLPILTDSNVQKIPMVWDEVLDLGVPSLHGNSDGSDMVNLPPTTIVQWWRGWMGQQVLENSIEKKFRVVQSHPYYLDHLEDKWTKMYEATLDERLYGGEACSWSETQDETNIDQRVFSKLPAVAERLWSSEERTNKGVVSEQTRRRMGRVLCMLKQRDGLRVGPSMPGYCSQVVAADGGDGGGGGSGLLLRQQQSSSSSFIHHHRRLLAMTSSGRKQQCQGTQGIVLLFVVAMMLWNNTRSFMYRRGRVV